MRLFTILAILGCAVARADEHRNERADWNCQECACTDGCSDGCDGEPHCCLGGMWHHWIESNPAYNPDHPELHPCGYPRDWLTGGYAATFLAPTFDNNPAFVTTSANPPAVSASPFDYDMVHAPRFWAGIAGVRVTYWHLDATATQSAVGPLDPNFTVRTAPIAASRVLPPFQIAAAAGGALNATTNLQMYYVDTEFTHQLGRLDLSFGVRQGAVSQRFQASNNVQTEIYGHRLDGMGPTLSVQYNVPLGGSSCAFVMTRGSLLCGQGKAAFQGVAVPIHRPFDVVTIGELQVGAESRRMLGIYELFGRIAFEGQAWEDTGNATSLDGSLGLLGLSLTTGFRY